MAHIWVEVWNKARTTLYGEINTAFEPSFSMAMDASAEWSFSMPAGDPDAALLVNERLVEAYTESATGPRIIGTGIVKNIGLSEDGETLNVSGSDLLSLLAGYSVGNLKICQRSWSYLTNNRGWVYWHRSPDMVRNMPWAYDGVTGVDGTAQWYIKYNDPSTVPGSWAYFYFGFDQRVDAFYVYMGTLKNSKDGTLLIQYQQDGGAWATVAAMIDGTKSGAHPLAHSGEISFTEPTDIVRTTPLRGAPNGYWFRVGLTAGSIQTDAVDINEVTAHTDLPTTTGLSLIIACVPAGEPVWSVVNPVTAWSTTANAAYLEFDGESVLAAFIALAKATGEHFRLPTPGELTGASARCICWQRTTWTTIVGHAELMPDALTPAAATGVIPILALSARGDTAELVTRVYPHGAGTGAARAMLTDVTAAKAATVVAPYVLDTVNNCIYNTDAETAYGRIESPQTFNNIAAIAEDAHYMAAQLAADQLCDAALAWLKTHDSVARFYTMTVAYQGYGVYPVDRLHAVAEIYRQSYKAININTYPSSALYVVGVTERIEDSGADVLDLELSTVEREAENDSGVLTNTIQQVRNVQQSGISGLQVVRTVATGNASITGGTINGATVGASNPAAGRFTSLSTASFFDVTHPAYGATGDGATDDTAALQAAINAASAAGGGVVWLPTGTYNITSPLYLYDHVTLRGSGKLSSIISKSTNTVGTGSEHFASEIDSYAVDAIVIVTHPFADAAREVVVENLRLLSNTCAYGLYAPRFANCRFENLDIVATTGFKAQSSWIGEIKHVHTDTNGTGAAGYGFHFDCTDTGGSASMIVMTNCFSGHAQYAYYLDMVLYSSMVNCQAEDVGQDATHYGVAFFLSQCEGFSMEGCGAEFIYGAALQFEDSRVSVGGFYAYPIYGVTDANYAVIMAGLIHGTSRVTISGGQFKPVVSPSTSRNMLINNYSRILFHNTIKPTNGAATSVDSTASLDEIHAGALTLGYDTNLYRDAADVLKTDDSLKVSRGLSSSGVYDVLCYGATGDGVTDDRDAIQAALTEANGAGGGHVYVPAGTYIIDTDNATNPLLVGSNTWLELSPQATFTQSPTGSFATFYCLVHLNAVDNVRISGGTFVGDIAGNSSGAENGVGIYVNNGCTNISICSAVIKECHCDGIYIGGTNANSNVLIDGCTVTGNRRNNIGIAHGAGIRVIGNTIVYATGTAPKSGIDIEPNASQSAADITITGNYIGGNTSYGVMACVGAGTGTRNVTITGNAFDDNGANIYASGVTGLTAQGNTVNAGSYLAYVTAACEDVVIANNQGLHQTGDGMYLEKSARMNIVGNSLHGSTGRGIRVLATASPWPLDTVIANNVVDSPGDDGIELTRCAGILISDNIVTGGSKNGISLETSSQHCQLNGNQVMACGQLTDLTYSGITLSGASHWNHVIGNTVRKASRYAWGTAQGPGAGNNQIQLATTATAIDDWYNAMIVTILSGLGSGQTRTITDYTGTGTTATVNSNWATNPDSTSVYEIYTGNRVQQGIIVNSGCIGNKVTDNDCYRFGTGYGVRDLGTSTVTTSANRES